jgi:hypothetical protein
VPDLTLHLIVVGMSDRRKRLKPTSHFGKESWHEGPTSAKLVDKWMNSVGKLPD